MNYKNIILTGIFLLSLTGCGNPSTKIVWSTDDSLRTPESVMYDSSRDILYIANINGKPTQKDNNGFISKISTDGKIRKLQWIRGMNAPKGMGIRGDKLYVTDIDRIHKIDIPSSKIEKTINVSNVKFLNDIAIDKKGNIYITDMIAKKIIILNKDVPKEWLTFSKYNRPNGLLIENNSLLVGTAEGLLRVDLKSKKIEMLINHKGGIDGLKADGKGSYIISDWKGKVQLINKNKKPIILSDTSKDKINAADLEYIPSKNLILIPTFFHNKVVAYKLSN